MKKNANKIYGCEVTHIKFPLSTQLWLQKYGFTKPIQVPVRRKCMTGSGIAQQCHSNVLQLVEIYGGYRLGGYIVDIDEDEDGNEFTFFVSHSVWVTPEGKAVDVTAHNFTEEDVVFFIPKYKESSYKNALLDFVLPKHFIKDGVLINVADEKNDEIAAENGLDVIQLEENLTFVRLPSSKFNYKLIHQSIDQKSNFDWKSDLPDGGFTQNSKWSKKSWDEIKAKNLQTV
jgi:hypothetical protein